MPILTQAHRGRPGRGFTLIEIIVASALFLLAGLVMFAVFQHGLKATEVGKLTMDMQDATQRAMKRMKDEVAMAVRPTAANFIGLDATGLGPASAVLKPSTEYPYSLNELVFVAPQRGTSTMNNSVLGSYVMVRYIVQGSFTGGANVLRRVVYRLGDSGNQPLAAFGAVKCDSSEAAPPAPSALSSPLKNVLTMVLDSKHRNIATPVSASAVSHFYVKTDMLDGIALNAFPNDPNKDVAAVDDIVFLGPTDQLSRDLVLFVASHGPVANPLLDSYHAHFDRMTFGLDVWARRYYRNDPSQSSNNVGLDDWRNLSGTAVIQDFQ